MAAGHLSPTQNPYPIQIWCSYNSIKACSIDFGSPAQWGHSASSKILRFRKLSLVGSEFVQAFQKLLNLAQNLQLSYTFPKSLLWIWDLWAVRVPYIKLIERFISGFNRIATQFFWIPNQGVGLWYETQRQRLDKSSFKWMKTPINKIDVPPPRYWIYRGIHSRLRS